MLTPAIIAAAHHCTLNQFGGQDCSLPVSDPLTIVGLVGALAVLLGGVVGAVAWIGALIRSARMQTWGWFAVVLLLLGLGTLLYALAGPQEQPAMMGANPSCGPNR
jgi:hypothetical protein